MFVIGLDIGSTTTKATVLNDKKKIISYEIIPTGANMVEAEKQVFNTVLEKANLERNQITNIVSSGYGRERSRFAKSQITEIKAMTLGAEYLFPGVRTLIDVGGQDNKAIKIKGGKVQDFKLNDKCAAGTGRFLELISKVLEIPIEEMSNVAKKARRFESLSKTCAVFAQTEVINLLSQGSSAAEIIQGSYEFIAKRVLSMATSLRIEQPIVLSGGVAKSESLVKMFNKISSLKVKVPDEPQLLGAIGSAIHGLA
ncbi:MAG: 2-hydroxyglutaryl-CoA dehydratase [Candidatus Heimdallarchaeota archaeon]|nr:2-hydroxyglutaryl-CoA dehydratase [Candidatus Heimdallarchaeota archaeon]MCG3254444.1 2-hydroxyglutaryl-CoA dehydratase [Candidatus Heimdallarchaeota archaeon]MCK4609528.1 2-hydroxyglutaryl-CoA dehydratase [Candidatus Heimdallarchaeota archaeon]